MQKKNVRIRLSSIGANKLDIKGACNKQILSTSCRIWRHKWRTTRPNKGRAYSKSCCGEYFV